MIDNDVMELSRIEEQYSFKFPFVVNGNAKALAAEHEPDDAEFPILETVQVRMRTSVKFRQWPGGDQVFPAAIASREKERDVGNLFGEDIDGAVHPDNL